MICKICNKNISLRGVPSHLARVHKINTKQYYDIFLKTTTEGVCKECGKKTNYISITKGYRQFCSTKCGNNNIDTINKIKNTNILKYGVANGRNTESLKKFKETCMQKYGVDNPFKSNIVKQKIASQIYNKFGVCCYLQTDAARIARKKAQRYIDICAAQAKRRLTCLVKYGVDHEWKDKKHRLKLYEKMKFTNISKQELFIRENITNWTQLLNYTCIFNDKSIIYPYELDLYIPDIKLAIEYNGHIGIALN